NPFNPSTSIRFYIPAAGFVLLEIFDINGSRISVLVNEYMREGDHLTSWNSNNISSGTYFYRMSYQGHTLTKSMVLLR
ncbi:MAG: T9SS type A sorting domain-containing protein, partial [Ignavibacteria bacterium]